MRILHVVARSHRRGAEMVALELADELNALGHDNSVVAVGLALDGGEDPDLDSLVAHRSVGPAVFATAAWRLRRRLARDPVDIVLAHGGWAAQVAAVAVPRRHGPTLVWQRILGFPPQVWRPGHRRWWEAVAKRIDVAVALTPDLEHELRRLGFAGPVWLIPNSRQPKRFEKIDRTVDGARLRQEVGVAAEVPIVGFVGHLVHQKRPERALAVLAGIHAGGQPAHLVIAGDGPLRATLEREVRTRGLRDHVTLLGHRHDIERVFGGLDVLVLTSEAEGIPGVAIEAQMAGCPVVTFPLGGVSEVVEDGVTGVVLERDDTRLMATRLVDLLADGEARTRMGAAARAQTPRFAASRAAQIYADELARLPGVAGGAGDGADGLRIYWYWPFARTEDVEIAAATVRPGDQLVIQTLDRPGVPSSTSSDPYVVVNDVPEVGPARERTVSWALSRSWTYLRRATARRRVLGAAPFDVVHVMYPNRFTDAFDLARLRRRHLLICSVHDAYPHEPRLPARVERWLVGLQFRNSNMIVVHNEGLKQILEHDFGIDPDTVEVIPHQVPRFPGAAEAEPDQPPMLLFFGTLRRNKGIEVLLDAIDRIERDDIRFHFAGRGFDDVEAMVRDTVQRDPRVTADLTWISPELKSELFGRSSLVVLPYTDFESESGVLHDAYGHGRPVIATDVGSLGHSVREDGTGWVIPPGDAAGLARTIELAVDDTTGRKEAALAAGNVAWSRRPEVAGAMLRDLYERLTRTR